MEVAAGAAYTGARALVTMKQVGLNVASDPLMSLNYIGVKGGMVVFVADDPGPISSHTEQEVFLFPPYVLHFYQLLSDDILLLQVCQLLKPHIHPYIYCHPKRKSLLRFLPRSY